MRADNHITNIWKKLQYSLRGDKWRSIETATQLLRRRQLVSILVRETRRPIAHSTTSIAQPRFAGIISEMQSTDRTSQTLISCRDSPRVTSDGWVEANSGQPTATCDISHRHKVCSMERAPAGNIQMKRYVWLLLTLVLPVLASAQTANKNSEPPFTAKGAFFALSVANLDASATWYSEKFDLKVVMRAPMTKDVRSAVIVLAGGGLLVELIESENAMPLSKVAPNTKEDRTLIHGVTKAGLIVDDFDTTLALLRERHVPILMGPFPAHDSTEMRNFIIEDNARNLIQFFGK